MQNYYDEKAKLKLQLVNIKILDQTYFNKAETLDFIFKQLITLNKILKHLKRCSFNSRGSSSFRG